MKNSIEKEYFTNKSSGDSTQQVLRSFKDMKKETIGQTYCYINQLLKNKANVDFDSLSELLELESLPLFEESLRLIAIDSLRLENYVFQIFLNQNNYQIKRILRCHWFFVNLNSEQLKTQIFPHISVSLRSKIISRLSKNLASEKTAEELFEFVLKSYGLAQAEILLSKCSENFILNYFSRQNIMLQHNNKHKLLFMLSKRCPKLGIKVFSLMCEKPPNHFSYLDSYTKILLYLARTNTEIFVPFFKNYYLKLLFLRFGSKISKKIGKEVKDILFKSKQLIKSDVFKKSALFKIFCFDDQVKFLAAVVIFEKDLLTFDNWKESVEHTLITYIKIISPNERMIMIEAVFKEVYDLKILDNSYLLNTKILELIPLNIRLPYLIAHAKSVSQDVLDDNINSQTPKDDIESVIMSSENFIYLLESDTAFKNLKLKLDRAPSIERRQYLLELMIQNCAINKDVDCLQIVVEFIGKRMRNDDPKVLMQILYRIFELFPLKAIKIEIIQTIEEIARLSFLKTEGSLRCFETVINNCILAKLNKNLDISRPLKDLVNYYISLRLLWGDFFENYNCENPHKLFLAFYEEVYRVVKTEYSNNIPEYLYSQLAKWILNNILEFNKFHKKNPILLDSCPELLSSIENSSNESLKKYINDVDLKNLIRKRPDLFLKSEFVLLSFMLKQNTEIFIKKLEVLFKHLFSNFNRNECKEFYFSSLKIFSFANLTEDIKKIIIKGFKNENSAVQKKNALKMFSYICNKEEFKELIQEYIPNKDKINVDVDKEFSQIQLLIPRVIKNIIPSYKNLDLILQFFEGDFLSNAIPSFSKYCFHTRIDHLISNLSAYFIEISNVRRISLKKEVIKILIRLTPRQNAVITCLDIWEKIDHYSIRLIILKQISKIFVENPTTELFHTLHKMIQESDEEVIEGRPQLSDIPESFLQSYVSTLWVFAENQKPEFKNRFRNSIISFFTIHNVTLLSETFCEEIIKNNLFKSKGLNVVKFSVDYLLCQKEDFTRKLNIFLEILKNSSANLSKISEFFKTLRLKSLNSSEFGEELFDLLSNNSLINTSNIFFDQRLILNYYRIYFSLLKADRNERALKFAESLIKFYSAFDDFNLLLTIFSETLQIFFEELKGDQNLNKMAILKKLLILSPNQGFAILIISVLPATLSSIFKCEDKIFHSTGDNFNDDLKFIFETLRTNSNTIIQIHFRRKFGFRKDEQSLMFK